MLTPASHPEEKRGKKSYSQQEELYLASYVMHCYHSLGSIWLLDQHSVWAVPDQSTLQAGDLQLYHLIK